MDNYITLNQLSNCMWYGQMLTVKDEKDSILFDGENYQLRGEACKELIQRWVRSFGQIDDRLIVKII